MSRWGAVLSGKFLSHKIANLKHARHKICIDGRRASTILRIDELCSRSGGDAREAMTVGCAPMLWSPFSCAREARAAFGVEKGAHVYGSN